MFARDKFISDLFDKGFNYTVNESINEDDGHLENIKKQLAQHLSSLTGHAKHLTDAGKTDHYNAGRENESSVHSVDIPVHKDYKAIFKNHSLVITHYHKKSNQDEHASFLGKQHKDGDKYSFGRVSYRYDHPHGGSNGVDVGTYMYNHRSKKITHFRKDGEDFKPV